MLDSATLNHAAQVLNLGSREDIPADAALRRHFLEKKYLGAREKRAISRATFAYFRWLQWLDLKASFQKQVEQAWTMHERFIADEKSVKAEALAALAVPEWLSAEMELPADFLRHLQRDPTLWLRARPGTSTQLARELGNCEVSDRAPDALRYKGMQDLFVTPAFHNGAFEIQDLASQIVSLACAPKPGETWWDACAGEGGKLLHLCDLMGNKGTVWASDRNERRLQTLKRRAARAKLFNYRLTMWDGGSKLPSKTKFDGILLDAPCSGVGTWQRNPHARWTVKPDDVRELMATQRRMLDHAVPALKPGGRLIYSVCTLTRSETTAVSSAFATEHADLEPAPLFDSAAESGASQLFLWPHELNANGMYIAAWRKKK